MYGKEGRRRLRAGATGVLPGILRALPESWGRGLCVAIGLGGYLVVGRDRRLAARNLARVHPDWDRGRIRRTSREVFREIGRNAYDFLRYPDLSEAAKDALVRIEGREHLDRALAGGRGAILVTAHLGCWELLAAGLARAGYPLKALARPLREARLDRMLRRHRVRMGVETLSSKTLPVQAVRHLRQGGVLGVLIDQRIRHGGTWVTFLGQPTRLTDAPARLALTTGSPLVPVGIRRLPGHRHEITVLPALAPRESGDAVERLTQDLAAAAEGLIRRAPEQWIWIHPRWNDAPPAQAATPPASGPSKEEDLCVSR